MRFSNGTPAASNSARIAGTSRAVPTPRTKRPREIRSSVASWCASRVGFRSIGSSTAVPSAIRSVRAAIAASSVIGSWRGLAISESPIHTESSPTCSATSPSSRMRSVSCTPTITRSRVGRR